MLVEAGISDAYGLPFEYAPAEFVAANNDGKTYRQSPRWPNLRPGVYSDDTQMMIGLAEHLVSGHAHTAVNLAGAFLRAFHRDQRAGYASRFYDLLLEVKTPEALLRRLMPQSDRSGGAMRAAPCGLLASPTDVIDMAIWQASLTHATRDGTHAAAGAALLAWACRHNIDRDKIPAFLEQHLPGFDWITPWTSPVGPPGLQAVRAALTAIAQGDSLTDVLRRSVAVTGDVDTSACIAMAAASEHPRIIKDLSPTLVAGLEPGGKYGLDYLNTLDDRLHTKFALV